jgi:hypothetical protein
LRFDSGQLNGQTARIEDRAKQFRATCLAQQRYG